LQLDRQRPQYFGQFAGWFGVHEHKNVTTTNLVWGGDGGAGAGCSTPGFNTVKAVFPLVLVEVTKKVFYATPMHTAGRRQRTRGREHLIHRRAARFSHADRIAHADAAVPLSR
jgi:hypothetical protein